MSPVVRASILRCAPAQFLEFRQMMQDADAVLRPGIEAMSGLIAFYVGDDEATASLSNISIWSTMEDALQLDGYQPMLDLGRVFVAKGGTFERPIMNYTTLWRINPGSI